MPQPAHGVLQKMTPPKLPALIAGVVWLCALLALTIFTANPVTLNRQQIRVSDFIVRGHFDVQNQKLLIEETWPTQGKLETIKLANIDQISADTETEYLVPVVMFDGRYHVTPSLVKGIPLVYGSEPESLAQLDVILSGKVLK